MTTLRRQRRQQVVGWGLLLVFFAASSSWAATYYVDPAGNNNNSGLSTASAWKTLSKVQDFSYRTGFRPGDNILLKRGGVWRERLITYSSGAEGQPITFDAYGSGAKPKILSSRNDLTWTSIGANLWATPTLNLTPNSNVGFILLTAEVTDPVIGVNVGKVVQNASDLDTEGEFFWEAMPQLGATYGRVVIYTTHASGPAVRWPLMEVGTGDRGVHILNQSYITVRNIDARYGTGGSFRIGELSHHITLDACEASYGGGTQTAILGMRAGDIVKIDTGSHDVVVQNCRVSNAWEAGISMEAWRSGDVIYNITVANNTVDRCSIGIAANTPYYDGITNTEMYNIYIRGNTVTNSGYGWTTPAMCSHGIGIWCYQNERAPLSLHDCFIEHNYVDKFAWNGIRLFKGQYIVDSNEIVNGTGVYVDGAYDRPSAITLHGGSANDTVGDTYGTIAYNLVHNNSTCGIFFVNNTPSAQYQVEVFNNTFFNNGTSAYPNFNVYTANNVAIRNNIFYSTVSIPFAVESANQIVSDYNCFYAPSGPMIKWRTTTYTLAQFANYRAASQQDAHSYAADPRFVSTALPNLHLTQTSPCIDKALDLGHGTDFEDLPVPQGLGADIGACEFPDAPSITVASPDGGEQLTAGNSAPISWSYSGSPGSAVNIELLKGTVPTLLASNVAIESLSWYWPIPSTQTPGTDYRVRVTSTSNSSYTDTSDATFTILAPPLPTLTVTSPNGGEQWAAWQTHRIEWTYTGNPGTAVHIEILDGTQATFLALNVPVGTNGSGYWDWNVPMLYPTGTNYRIRLMSTSVSGCTDTSDAPFSITAAAAPTITVVTPNGGETWTTLETKAIQWSYTGTPGATVRIDLLDGTLSTVLASSAAIGASGSGSWDWSIPNTLAAGSNYRIRLTVNDSSTVTDTSDATFAITVPPPNAIAVASPTGGENWSQGETRTIRWDYTGNPGAQVRIELTTGTGVVELASGVSIGSGGAGSWNWPISLQQEPRSDYRIRITSTSDPSITDTSDGTFTIHPTIANSITVAVPNGEEHWLMGETHAISWYYTGSPGSNVRIELIRGSSVSVLASSVPIGNNGQGSWNWWISYFLDTATNYRIRITSLSYPDVSDLTDGYFTISRWPSVHVEYPNGSETWPAGSRQEIRWSYAGNPGSTVRIRLLRDGYSPVTLAQNISIGTSGRGSWYWNIPSTQTPADNYRIDVTTEGFFFRSDATDGYFSIVVDPPVISGVFLEPSEGKSLVGESVTLRVELSSGTPPLSYQWQRDGVDIAGATNQTLVLDSINESDEGAYRCRVTNVIASVVSDAVILQVAYPLRITTQPQGATRLWGESYTFTVQAADGFQPISYQWYFEGSPLPGATSGTLLVQGLDYRNEGDYSVVVTDSASNHEKSDDALLMVDTAGVPAVGIVGLCIVVIVCVMAGAFIIFRR